MSKMNRTFSIGKLSEYSRCKIETIRYYEKIGLLSAPPRTEGGHRIYSDDHAKRLGFVRRSRELGFSIAQIRTLLGLADGETFPCGEVKALTLGHLQNVKEKLRDLRKLERTLIRISDDCGGTVAPACPIIEALFEGRF